MPVGVRLFALVSAVVAVVRAGVVRGGHGMQRTVMSRSGSGGDTVHHKDRSRHRDQ